jgi:excisionase family DNA binding protein
MTKTPSELWLTVPEVCQRLGVTPGKVHRLVEERGLLGAKKDGVFHIPEAFLDGDQPLASLRGTAVVLLDGGFTQDTAIEWLFSHDDALGARPIDALTQGRKTEVRRLAQTLAF